MSALTVVFVYFQGIVTPGSDGFSRSCEMPNVIGGSETSMTSGLMFGRNRLQGSHPDWSYGQRNFNTPPRSRSHYLPAPRSRLPLPLWDICKVVMFNMAMLSSMAILSNEITKAREPMASQGNVIF